MWNSLFLTIIVRWLDMLKEIHLLESKLEKLFSDYELIKSENVTLLENTETLRHQLIEKEQLLKKQKSEYDLLKIAKTIEGSITNKRDTKLKINVLIREIDKCIVELQE